MATYVNRSFATALALALTSTGLAAAAEESPAASEEAPAVQTQDEHEETFWSPRKKEPARMGVALNPLGLIFGMILAEFDYGLNDTLSLNINASYWDIGLSTAYGAGVGAQLFLPEVADSGPLYQGFYVYPSLQVFSVTVDPLLGLTEEYEYVSVAPRAVAGWQWDWRPFTVRMGAGLEYFIASDEAGYDLDLQGLRLVLDGTVGLTF